MTLCGTGILPVPDGQDAHPTRKHTLCGTGILPVLDDCKQLQKNRLFVEQASCLFLTKSHTDYESRSSFSTAIKASCGTSTVPTDFIRFLPFACFCSNFFFREISPP